jgi:hypothetical protein
MDLKIRYILDPTVPQNRPDLASTSTLSVDLLNLRVVLEGEGR